MHLKCECFWPTCNPLSWQMNVNVGDPGPLSFVLRASGPASLTAELESLMQQLQHKVATAAGHRAQSSDQTRNRHPGIEPKIVHCQFLALAWSALNLSLAAERSEKLSKLSSSTSFAINVPRTHSRNRSQQKSSIIRTKSEAVQIC